MQEGATAVLLSLLLAHLLGDFVLQWDGLVEAKRRQPLLAYSLHGAIHYAVAVACLVLFGGVSVDTPALYVLALVLVVVHLLIDWVKGTIEEGPAAFLADQGGHLIALVLFSVPFGELPEASLAHVRAWIVDLPPTDLRALLTFLVETRVEILRLAVVYVGVIFGGGQLIRTLMAPLEPMAAEGRSKERAVGRPTGMYIGWLERFLILTALLIRSPEAAGLIVAAKSVVRYPEFQGHESADYFLIGTLLSVALAVAGGVLLLELLYGAINLG